MHRWYITISGLEISAVKQISVQGSERIYGAYRAIKDVEPLLT